MLVRTISVILGWVSGVMMASWVVILPWVGEPESSLFVAVTRVVIGLFALAYAFSNNRFTLGQPHPRGLRIPTWLARVMLIVFAALFMRSGLEGLFTL